MAIVKMCAECNALFTVMPTRSARTENQKRCPRCIAAADDRIKSIPLQRRAVFHRTVVVGSLPPKEWIEKRKRSHDNPYWQIDIRGRDVQEGWSAQPPAGRIVINATYPVKPGDVVRLKIVRALHDTKDNNQEVREYISLCQASSYMTPDYMVEWCQENTWPPNLEWAQDGDGAWRRSVVGDDMGHLVISQMNPQATEPEASIDAFDYGDLSDEDLLGESSLTRIRGILLEVQ